MSGRDVESIIRDLTELAMGMVKTEHMAKVREKAKTLAEDRLLDLLLPIPKPAREMQKSRRQGAI